LLILVQFPLFPDLSGQGRLLQMESYNEDVLKEFLDRKAAYFERPSFIVHDPISIPHRFHRQQDIEIAGFFAAILAWGNRKSIIASSNRLLSAMDNAPYDFIMNFSEPDLAAFGGFAHRTFQAADLFHFLDFLQYHYRTRCALSLETAFTGFLQAGELTIEKALTGFHRYFFDETIFGNYLPRTRKHIATPERNSACKRLNMFLRWMVRSSERGVDFGLWKSIRANRLICPLDLHSGRVALRLGLLTRPSNDWKAALELTSRLREFDPEDPVKYDYALFGLGVSEKF